MIVVTNSAVNTRIYLLSIFLNITFFQIQCNHVIDAIGRLDEWKNLQIVAMFYGKGITFGTKQPFGKARSAGNKRDGSIVYNIVTS